MKNKIIHYLIIGLFILTNPFSCGKEYPFADEADCEECYTSKPEVGPIHIDLTANKSVNGAYIRVYKGKYLEEMEFDDSRIVFEDVVYKTDFEVDVPLDEYYSVVAEYIVGDIKYRVVDGDKIKLYSIKNTCDYDCWIIKGGKMNCKLKF